ncbi:alpha/beta hydrolase [Loktanella agnita]|uniref:alpha/beta hydrolase n=1 Tax=Loktanella agnita TaxID=287097 RepID=UPI0039872594
MLSKHQKFWNAYARIVQKPTLAMITSQPLARRAADLNAILSLKTPPGLQLTDCALTHAGENVRTTVCQTGPVPAGGTMLYLHGGAFMIGSLRMYRHLVARLGQAADQRAHFLHYGLAPEHPYPHALDQATAAYLALCADPAAGPISLVGDSAGGNLVLALLHRICSRDLPRPAAVVALSPLTDMRFTAASLHENARSDHLVPVSWARRGQNAYRAGADPENPELSPVLGDFTDAPPCLIHADETEMLVDDSRAMAKVLKDQGIPVTLTLCRGRTHVWHLNVGRCPEADASIAEIGQFIRDVTFPATP